MSVVWTAALGVAAGLIARLVTPGRKGPFGFYADRPPWHRRRRCGLVSGARGRMVSGARQHRGDRSRLRSSRPASDLGCSLQEPTSNLLHLTPPNPAVSSLVNIGSAQ